MTKANLKDYFSNEHQELLGITAMNAIEAEAFFSYLRTYSNIDPEIEGKLDTSKPPEVMLLSCLLECLDKEIKTRLLGTATTWKTTDDRLTFLLFGLGCAKDSLIENLARESSSGSRQSSESSSEQKTEETKKTKTFTEALNPVVQKQTTQKGG